MEPTLENRRREAVAQQREERPQRKEEHRARLEDDPGGASEVKAAAEQGLDAGGIERIEVRMGTVTLYG